MCSSKLHLSALLPLMSLLGAVPSWAQNSGELQWRVVNQAAPAIVPLYERMPSPFPISQAAKAPAEDVPTGPTEEEIQQQKAILAATSKVSSMVSSMQALEPNLSGLQFGGSMQGPAGYAVLLNGKWVKAGTRLQVPSQASRAVMEVIQTLDGLDPQAAESYRATLIQRVASTPSVLSITRITSQSVVLQQGGRPWTVPLRQEKD